MMPTPLHTFRNDQDNTESYVWPGQKPGMFNVTMKDLDSGEFLPTGRRNIPDEKTAITLAKRWVGEPHREIHASLMYDYRR